MATYLKDNNIDGNIVCIDTWLGSPEHQRMSELMRSDMGAPAIMYQFVANMQHLGLTDYVYPFPISATTSHQTSFTSMLGTSMNRRASTSKSFDVS
jgi:hypothetical protein